MESVLKTIRPKFVCKLLFVSACVIFIAIMLFSSYSNSNVTPTDLLSLSRFKILSVNPLASVSSTNWDVLVHETRTVKSYQERLQRINQVCQSATYLRLNMDKRIVEENWITASYKANKFKRTQLQWCPVFKAASTPWLAILLKLRNHLSSEMEDLVRNGTTNLLHFARYFGMKGPYRHKTTPKLTQLDAINSTEELSLSILVVRHPFERLLSAFRDKLERREGREYYYQRFGRHIVRLFRKPSLSADGSQIVNSSHPYEMPTFEEFVRFVLTQPTYAMNEHWRPAYVNCNACTHQFNIVMKVETMDEDRDYLFSLLGVDKDLKENLVQVWRRWSNAAAASDHRRQDESINRYFSKVSKTDLKKLYKLYEPDFVMFDYHVDAYLK